MHENTEKTLTRDCAATRIPSGEAITLASGTRVFITQALGGSYTVATDQGLARIACGIELRPVVRAAKTGQRIIARATCQGNIVNRIGSVGRPRRYVNIGAKDRMAGII